MTVHPFVEQVPLLLAWIAYAMIHSFLAADGVKNAVTGGFGSTTAIPLSLPQGASHHFAISCWNGGGPGGLLVDLR